MRRVSEGTLLALLTAGAYWIAYRYEVAYLGAYGFPSDLPRASAQSTLVVVLALSGGIWTLFLVGNMVAMSWPSHRAMREKLIRVSFVVVLTLWNLISYGPRRKDLSLYLGVAGFLILVEVVWPILVYRKKGKIRERFIADEEAEASTRDRLLWSRLFMAVGPTAYLLGLAIFFGGQMASTAGDAKARRQTEYLVYASEPEVAVVRFYDDVALCVHVDVAKRTVDRIILRPNTGKGMTFKKATIGPLELPANPHTH